jgi:hypothetical protein
VLTAARRPYVRYILQPGHMKKGGGGDVISNEVVSSLGRPPLHARLSARRFSILPAEKKRVSTEPGYNIE